MAPHKTKLINDFASKVLLLLGLCLSTTLLFAAELSIAVASNFASPMAQLTPLFEKQTGHRLIISIGSSGKFYTKIKQGAPFEVLLAADAIYPQRLEQEATAVAGSRFTYAIGKLALWSSQPGYVDSNGEVLTKMAYRHLAIANPKLAPYGLAAQQVLEKQGLWPTIQAKLVLGENIAQTHQFVASGNAELGLVALSQLMQNGQIVAGSYWIVPESLYAPIQQQAVILTKGRNNPATGAFLQFLRSQQARTIIQQFGYALP